MPLFREIFHRIEVPLTEEQRRRGTRRSFKLVPESEIDKEGKWRCPHTNYAERMTDIGVKK